MAIIHVIGLGPGNYRDITAGALELLQSSMPVYFRTEIHPVVAELRGKGIKFQSFDTVYEQAHNFDAVYQTIAEEILRIACTCDVVYAVPGHPLVAEQSVANILKMAKESGTEVRIVPAVSFLDVMFSALQIDPVNGLMVVDGLHLDKQRLDVKLPVVITQVYNPLVASNVKIRLMDDYPDEHRIAVVRSAGVPDEERIVWIPLYELDRLPWINHLTSVYLPACTGQGVRRDYDLTPLVEVMDNLRSPGGCPWDIEQTHASLKRYAVEEVYEVLEAIDLGDMDKLCDELGDLLLQVVFHARIAEEQDSFSMQDVIDGVTAKMLRRHPHVFGNGVADTADDVMVNWEQIKLSEQAGQQRVSRLDGVPMGLPALMRAFKLQAKAKKIGFDWERIEDVWEKVCEETAEFQEVYQQNNNDKMEAELGDLLFAVVNVARFSGIEPETALHRTNNKFLRRFQSMEKTALERGSKIEKLSLEQLEELWNEAKRHETA